MQDMHRDVSETSKSNRMKQTKHLNSKNNIVAQNFAIGDFVLSRRAQDRF